MNTVSLLASEHVKAGAMEFNIVPYLTTIIVFVIVFVLLAWFVWPKILGFLDEREQKILSDLRSADEAREQAKAALADYERSLAEARQEAGKLIAQAKADAQAVANDLRARNESELAEMKQRAMRDIGAARASAVSELHAEAATLATAMARKILQREVSPGDQQRLVEESLKELAVSRKN
ncbi:MAG: F0F1 ATP synthase subunit B [Phycisphaerales bacterium]